MSTDNEFYIGYLKKAPEGLAKHMKLTSIALLVAAPIVLAFAAATQGHFDRGAFEFGVEKQFEGILCESPFSYLRISAPNSNASTGYLLVGAGKQGLPKFAQGHAGEHVRFKGTLIYRDNMTMIEMNDPASFQSLGKADAATHSVTDTIGNISLRGEIVDTKYFFGVMRPATGKVHRACAIRCLEGGVPPGLLVRDTEGNDVVYILAGPQGKRLNFDTQWAALEVTVNGTLEITDGIPVVRATDIHKVENSSGTSRSQCIKPNAPHAVTRSLPLQGFTAFVQLLP